MLLGWEAQNTLFFAYFCDHTFLTSCPCMHAYACIRIMGKWQTSCLDDLSCRVLYVAFGGNQICVWGESFSAGNLAFRSLTIGAGAAETFWLGDHAQGSGPGTATGMLAMPSSAVLIVSMREPESSKAR